MPRPKKADPHKTCKSCGAKMERKRFGATLEDRSVFLRRKFCNRACMAAWMEGQIKVASAHNSRRQSAKRRRPACEACGATKRLHVHHRDGNPLNNTGSNLQTLCATCHMHTHWREWKATTRPPKPCSVCTKSARRLGLCNTHYARYRRHGDPLVVKRFNGHGKPVYLRASESWPASRS